MTCSSTLHIDVELFDGLYYAECEETPGLLGCGDSPEEAADDLIDWINGIVWN
jgi:predicted RNase H-like HicB family nuclease